MWFILRGDLFYVLTLYHFVLVFFSPFCIAFPLPLGAWKGLRFVIVVLSGDVLTCYFVLVFFSPLSNAITSLGEKRANLSVFRTFVRFVLVWFYRFPLSLGVWKGLWFVIMALPGLFSYLFCDIVSCHSKFVAMRRLCSVAFPRHHENKPI